jgi:hypothetical protein
MSGPTVDDLHEYAVTLILDAARSVTTEEIQSRALDELGCALGDHLAGYVQRLVQTATLTVDLGVDGGHP